MDKGELRKSDLFAQFAMAAATQAVNDSEILGKIDPERFGVYFGSGIGGIQTFSNQMTVLNEKGPKRISAYFIPMLIANIAGGNIAIKFNAQAPACRSQRPARRATTRSARRTARSSTAISTRSSRAARKRRSRRSAWRASAT
mgnify:CR=1 FL=1